MRGYWARCVDCLRWFYTAGRSEATVLVCHGCAGRSEHVVDLDRLHATFAGHRAELVAGHGSRGR